MLESRDRLVRTVDIAAEYARWRLGLGSSLFDQCRQLAHPVCDGMAAITVWRDSNLRTRRIANGRSGGRDYLRWTGMPSTAARGTLATTRGSGGGSSVRGVNSPLPSWYPRTPLQDITTVVRAYDRRRELSRLTGGRNYVDPKSPVSLSTAYSSAGATFKHDASMFTTPCPSGTANSRNQSVGNILLLDIVNKKSGGDSEFLTPQRKLLNEIDTVSKAVWEEIRQFNETPLVKKAERERKVRVLMSMR